MFFLFSQVSWIPLQKKGDFGILSACSGGRVLLWTVDSGQGKLALNAAYAFVQQQLPRSSSFKVSIRTKDLTTTRKVLIRWKIRLFLEKN